MQPTHMVSRPSERLGVLFPGMGAVATTTIAGVMLARRGLAPPVGSLTQLGSLRVDGSSAEVPVRDALALTPLDGLVFGGWDLFSDNAYEVAVNARVLEDKHLELVRDELSQVRPMTAAFYPEYVRRLRGDHVKKATSKADMVEQLRADIRAFKRDNRCDRLVAVWCGSTEVYMEPAAVHATLEAFEAGLARSAPEVSNSQLYAWACLLEGVPFANGSPNLAADFPAAIELSRRRGVPLAGKDFKTGQTLMKTILAPGFRARYLGVRGWFSTNILGNRDGEVLDDPDSFRAKEVTKLGVLESILRSDLYPELYGKLSHKVRIDYYPPRGDAKEGWDSIDIFGWLGYPMQIKVNFLCRDSILAAPVVLDLALLLDASARAGMRGIQDWLGFYFKSPMTPAGHPPLHDLFAQAAALDTTLRRLAQEHRAAPVAAPAR
jgi:myo-inositol-1-phosphate synthase